VLGSNSVAATSRTSLVHPMVTTHRILASLHPCTCVVPRGDEARHGAVSAGGSLRSRDGQHGLSGSQRHHFRPRFRSADDAKARSYSCSVRSIMRWIVNSLRYLLRPACPYRVRCSASPKS
jgi:hypothetical protein